MHIIGSAVRNYYPSAKNINPRSATVTEAEKIEALSKTHFCARLNGWFTDECCRKRQQYSAKARITKGGYSRQQSIEAAMTCGDCKKKFEAVA